MTDDEQNAYADMLAMLIKIHAMIDSGDEAETLKIYDEVGAVIAAAQAAATSDSDKIVMRP